MSDEQALLAAIWEHPHEDTPRLVYADWLDENGQPERAEFIRVQIELARLDEWDDSSRKAELQTREKQLKTKHGMEWKAALPEAQRKRAGFHRGFPFPQLRNLPSSKFLKLTAADFAGAPLWTFRLPPNTKALPQVLAFPLLIRIGVLDLQLWIEKADEVKQFVASPHVRNVADLNLGPSRLNDAGMRELVAGAAAIPHLRRLGMEFCRLTNVGAELLANSPLADQLEHIDLSHNSLEKKGIGPGGIEALAASPRLGRLRFLDIGYGVAGSEVKGVAGKVIGQLCESPHLTSLKSLRLDQCGLSDPELAIVCHSHPKFRLAELNLSSQRPKLGNAGAVTLASWPALAEVRVLHLHCNEIGADGAMALVKSPYLDKITELRLDLNPLRHDTRAVAALRERFGEALKI